MYAKLAIGNMRRSMKDYTIYFVTITLTAALMYSFLALGFSEDIISMSENMSLLTSGILGLSVLVALMASFVIGYAVRFMLGQRKKEFATYELLGMESRRMQKLFFIEIGIIGIFAFLLGTLSGTALSGLLVQLVNNIFDTPHRYRLSFSIKAWGIALLLFAGMYGFGILRAAKIIRKSKIVMLLYDSHKNETVKNGGSSMRIPIVLLSALSMTAGGIFLYRAFLLQTNAAFAVIGGAGFLLTAGIYGMYRNIPYLLLNSCKKNRKKKYTDVNLFYLGQIGRKIQSAGRMMAIIAILLTLALPAMFSGLAMGAGFKANMEAYYPYDAGIALDAPFTKDSMEPIIAFTNDKCPVQEDLTFYLYKAEGYPIEALSLSDYNRLREMLGLKKVELKADGYRIHCDTWNYMDDIRKALEAGPGVALAGVQLLASEEPIGTEPMEQYQMAGTKGYVLVVPDAVAAQLPADKIRLVMKLENGGFPELRQEIRRFINDNKAWTPRLKEGGALPEQVAMGVSVKAWGVKNSLTGFTALSFCGMYLSILCIILSCTVLAFEQLSALDHNRRSYRILDKMGVDKKTQRRLIQKEISSFFFIPAVLPVTGTVIFVIGSESLFGISILQENLIPMYGAITLLVFACLYMAYYWATSSIFKQSVLYSYRRGKIF